MLKKISCILGIAGFCQFGIANTVLPNDYYINLGAFTSSEGKNQHINKTGLIGNQYLLSHSHDTAGLIGFGALWHIKTFYKLSMSVGVDYSYFDNTNIKGDMLIENALRNLSYQYTLHHNSILLKAQFTYPIKNTSYESLFEMGIGPNFITTQSYLEKSLDGVTAPANTFEGRTSTTLAFRIGVSMLASNLSKTSKFGLGYRFNYLGKGRLKSNVGNVLNNLSTGSVSNHAVIFSVYF